MLLTWSSLVPLASSGSGTGTADSCDLGSAAHHYHRFASSRRRRRRQAARQAGLLLWLHV